MEDKKVSIIVPIYNAEKYLKATVESILAQTYKNIELILIDDGSKDLSGAICDEFAEKDDRVKVIHKQNDGVSMARNDGLNAATGDYIGFVDADDTIKPYMYERLVKAIEKYNAQMAMGSYDKVEVYSGKVTTVEIPYANSGDKTVVDSVIFQMAFWNCRRNGLAMPTIYGSTWPNLYLASIIKENKLYFDKQIVLGEDMLFNLKYLLLIDKISFVKESLYEYNMFSSSATRGKRPKLWEQYLTLLKEQHELLKDRFHYDGDYTYNMHFQVINFATGVIEEQICPAKDMSFGQKLKGIRQITSSKEVREALKGLKGFPLSNKDKVKFVCFKLKFNLAIYFWLNH